MLAITYVIEKLTQENMIDWSKILLGIESIISAFGALAIAGPAGWIAIGVALLLSIGSGFSLWWVIKKWYSKQIHQKTIKQRAKDQAETVKKDQSLSKKWRDARTKIDKIRERMRKKREERKKE